MEESNRLIEFGLTKNQAELLKFFIESKSKDGLTYKQIKEQFRFKKHFYRELIDDLVNLKFLRNK